MLLILQSHWSESLNETMSIQCNVTNSCKVEVVHNQIQFIPSSSRCIADSTEWMQSLFGEPASTFLKQVSNHILLIVLHTNGWKELEKRIRLLNSACTSGLVVQNNRRDHLSRHFVCVWVLRWPAINAGFPVIHPYGHHRSSTGRQYGLSGFITWLSHIS